MKNEQIDHHVCINISFHPSISILDHFLPDFPIPDFLYQPPPLGTPKGLLSLIGIQLHYCIQDCQVQAPNLDSGCATRFGYRRRFRRGIRLVGWVRCDNW